MKHYVEIHPTEKSCYTLAFGKDLVIDPNKYKNYKIIYNLVGAIDLPDFGDLLDEEN